MLKSYQNGTFKKDDYINFDCFELVQCKWYKYIIQLNSIQLNLSFRMCKQKRKMQLIHWRKEIWAVRKLQRYKCTLGQLRRNFCAWKRKSLYVIKTKKEKINSQLFCKWCYFLLLKPYTETLQKIFIFIISFNSLHNLSKSIYNLEANTKVNDLTLFYISKLQTF
jgi:hypothetical protein